MQNLKMKRWKISKEKLRDIEGRPRHFIINVIGVPSGRKGIGDNAERDDYGEFFTVLHNMSSQIEKLKYHM